MTTEHTRPEKFGVFWYNDAEIHQWGDREFEQKAADFASAGITIVMTFSCTHFRWNFQPWFKEINEALAKMVKACHAHGIKVVEHHSCHLTFNPRDKAEWDYAATVLKVRRSSLDSFPGLRDFIASGDPEILPGVRLSSCRQIDGRTGDYARSSYHGYALCFNNPNYRKAYFNYLETVYATGIDGIMTDDVHYFGYGHACACQHCREKFKEMYGHTLPSPDEWGKFAGDYSNPAFVDWLRFRFDSTIAFQEAVTQHAKSLNLSLLRPNYHTSTFTRNTTAYPFELAGHLWSHVFQENMFSSIMRAAWPSWSCDAVHRKAMGQKYGIEAMSMFYPAREDDYYFCWSLSRMWEHLLMATPEGGDLNGVEKKFYNYELKHPRWTKAAEKPANIAFVEPRRSLDLGPDALKSSCRPFNAWMQGALFRNISFWILFEDEPLEAFQKYPMVVLAGATMLSDAQLELLRQYCQQGGRLLIFGDFGIWRPNGSRREHPESIFGFTADLSELQPVPAGTFCWNGQEVALPPVNESRQIDSFSGDAEIIAQGEDNRIYGVSAMNGNLIWLAGGVRHRGVEDTHYAFTISRWSDNGQTAKATAPDYAAGYIHDVPGAILKALMPRPTPLTLNSEEYLITHFTRPDSGKTRFYLVNVSGLLARPPEQISHGDIFRHFTPGAPRNASELVLTFHSDEARTFPTEVTASSPELPDAVHLKTRQNGNALEIIIPPDTFAGFLEIEF